jgi:hypothetical protein
MDFKGLIWADLINDGNMEAQLNALQLACNKCALAKFTLKGWQYTTIVLISLPPPTNSSPTIFSPLVR